MISFPIPAAREQRSLAEFNRHGLNLGDLAAELNPKHARNIKVHMDPDIDRDLIPRPKGWRPALGQVKSAQSHLANQHVGVGDLFLFYGWFRQIEQANGRYRYKASAPDVHVLFGWLQIADIRNVHTGRDALLKDYPGLAQHNHVAEVEKYRDEPSNTLYIGAKQLQLPGHDGLASSVAGAGTFPGFAEHRQLTERGKSRRYWRLPEWFYRSGRPILSYHDAPKKWQALNNQHVLLETAAIGQEFVADIGEDAEAVAWVASLFKD